MNIQEGPDTPAKVARILNLIQFALVSGLVMGAIVILGTDALKGLVKPNFVIDPMIIAMAITSLVVSTILPPILRSVPPGTQVSVEELCAKYNTSMVVKYGLLEGPAFAVVFLNKDKSIFGILVLLVLVIVLIMSVVLPSHVEEYINHIQEEQELGE